MDFWDFSLELYAQPDVARACVALQDGCDADVNLMLFALWAARQGVRLTQADLTRVDAAVQGWRSRVVRPLRAVRRALKPAPEGFDAAAETLRDLVGAAELEAERQQQSRLTPLLPGAGEAPSTLLATTNLDVYAQAISARFPQREVVVLLTAWEHLRPIRTGLASPG